MFSFYSILHFQIFYYPLLLLPDLLALGEIALQFPELDLHHPVFFDLLLLLLAQSFIMVQLLLQVTDSFHVLRVLYLNVTQLTRRKSAIPLAIYGPYTAFRSGSL